MVWTDLADFSDLFELILAVSDPLSSTLSAPYLLATLKMPPRKGMLIVLKNGKSSMLGSTTDSVIWSQLCP
jgi:hypothetical protein